MGQWLCSPHWINSFSPISFSSHLNFCDLKFVIKKSGIKLIYFEKDYNKNRAMRESSWGYNFSINKKKGVEKYQ